MSLTWLAGEVASLDAGWRVLKEAQAVLSRDGVSAEELATAARRLTESMDAVLTIVW